MQYIKKRFWWFAPFAVMALLYIFSAVNALAATTPSATMQTSIDKALIYLKQPEYADPATRPPLRQAIFDQMDEIFDFDEFSARSVGRHWKKLTPAQQSALSKAFADLLAATYLDKVQGYNGEEIVYLGELISKKGDRAEVRTVLTLANGTPVPVAYRMIFKDSKWAVYDIIIENISLIKNYRSQFSSILQTGSPEELIVKIQERAEALHNATGAETGFKVQ